MPSLQGLFFCEISAFYETVVLVLVQSIPKGGLRHLKEHMLTPPDR